MMTEGKSFNERMAERDTEDLRTILKSVWGRRFVWRVMAICGVFSQSFVPDNSEATAFNEGRRSIGNTLLRQVIEINPESYLQMVKANRKDEEYARQCERSERESTDE